MPAEITTGSVVVGTAARELRRTLGPTSWMVLEELLLNLDGASDVCVACDSVRTLAASLGLAKDTVASAVRRLRDLGLVTAVQHRTDAGMFGTGTYLVSIPGGITLFASVPAGPQPRSRVPRDYSQLSFAIEF